jgi:hypothetical protein
MVFSAHAAVAVRAPFAGQARRELNRTTKTIANNFLASFHSLLLRIE